MLLYKEIVYNRTYYIISLQKLISSSLLLLLLTGSSRDVLPHQTGINSRFFGKNSETKVRCLLRTKIVRVTTLIITIITTTTTTISDRVN